VASRFIVSRVAGLEEHKYEAAPSNTTALVSGALSTAAYLQASLTE
jgi:hypothetical protein